MKVPVMGFVGPIPTETPAGVGDTPRPTLEYMAIAFSIAVSIALTMVAGLKVPRSAPPTAAVMRMA